MIVHSENEYEDLLGQWSDLESGLAVVLSAPTNTQQFAHRVVQYDRWMQGLLQRDSDVGLYLLFQLAANSPVGYSASHALVCAVLCHLVARELKLAPAERDSVVRAALTMNIGMTTVQDTLAAQNERPTPEQQQVIRMHPSRGAMLLASLGVNDEAWLDIVAHHHDEGDAAPANEEDAQTARLTRIVKVVDRYAAMISPRSSRAGRSAAESLRNALSNTTGAEELGHALVRAVGFCPPGTFVRMDSDELGLVLRRSLTPNLPFVAILGKPTEEVFGAPRLHATASGAPRIRSALAAAVVRVHLNHYQILQLSDHAASL